MYNFPYNVLKFPYEKKNHIFLQNKIQTLLSDYFNSTIDKFSCVL